MIQLPLMIINFKEELPFEHVPAFRSAVSSLAGTKNVLFHQHLDNGKTLYKYPLIQYKSINGKASIVCLSEGTEAIQEFLSLKRWQINILDHPMELHVDSYHLNHYPLQVWNNTFTYTYKISRWFALNSENYRAFIATQSLKERITMLENILVAHILEFAEGVKWTVDKKILVNIMHLSKQQWLPYKNIHVLTFEVNFMTNVFLPNYIGLGKAVSVGFGTVRRIFLRDSQEKQEE